MRKTFWFTCAAAICAVTAGVATQTPDTSTQTTGKTVTVSGCVQRAADTGTTSASAASGATTKFELTNAMMGSGAAGTTSSAAGTASGTAGSASEATGTSGRAGAAKTYRLDASDSQLSGHINHKVEITGTLEDASASASASGTTGSASETAGASASAKAAPRLKVQSVKMVSATCP